MKTVCTITFRMGSEESVTTAEVEDLTLCVAFQKAHVKAPVGVKLNDANHFAALSLLDYWAEGLRPGLGDGNHFARVGHVTISASDDGTTPILEVGWLTITFEETT